MNKNNFTEDYPRFDFEKFKELVEELSRIRYPSILKEYKHNKTHLIQLLKDRMTLCYSLDLEDLSEDLLEIAKEIQRIDSLLETFRRKRKQTNSPRNQFEL